MLKLTTTPAFAASCLASLHEGELVKPGSKGSLFASRLSPRVKSPHSGQTTPPTSLAQKLLRKHGLSARQTPAQAAKLHQAAAACDDTAVFAAPRP